MVIGVFFATVAFSVAEIGGILAAGLQRTIPRGQAVQHHPHSLRSKRCCKCRVDDCILTSIVDSLLWLIADLLAVCWLWRADRLVDRGLRVRKLHLRGVWMVGGPRCGIAGTN